MLKGSFRLVLRNPLSDENLVVKGRLSVLPISKIPPRASLGLALTPST